MVTQQMLARFVEMIKLGIPATQALGRIGISGASSCASDCRALMHGLTLSLSRVPNSPVTPDRINAVAQLGQLNPELGQRAVETLQSLGRMGGQYASQAIAQLRHLGGQAVQVVRGLEQIARSMTGGSRQALDELSHLARFSQAAREALQRLAQVPGHIGNTARQNLSRLGPLVAAASTVGGMPVGTATVGTLVAGAAGAVAVAGVAGYTWSQAPMRNTLQPTGLGGGDAAAHPDAEIGSRRVEPNTIGLYVVVKVEKKMGFRGGGIYSIRSTDDLRRGVAYSSYRHGGTSGAKTPVIELRKPCALHLAQQFLVSKIQVNSMRNAPHAGGVVGIVYGGDATIDDWGAIDAVALMAAVNR